MLLRMQFIEFGNLPIATLQYELDSIGIPGRSGEIITSNPYRKGLSAIVLSICQDS
jgi:hypothetical protein